MSRTFTPLGQLAAQDPLTGLGNRRFLFDALEREGTTGWVACWWDDRWAPPMFRAFDGDEPGEPTAWGAFVLAELGRG